MALIPSIKLCLKSNCTELSISETTGVYNASTNIGGYGSPNPVIGDITTAVLTVIAPDETQYTINLFTHGFPTSNTNFEYLIDLANLGNRSSIEDGYWQFIYTLNVGSYIANVAYFFYCNSECCVSKLLSAIEVDECQCDEKNNRKIDNYVKAKTYLQSLKNAATCFNLSNFNTIKAFLDKLCKNTGCKTCN